MGNVSVAPKITNFHTGPKPPCSDAPNPALYPPRNLLASLVHETVRSLAETETPAGEHGGHGAPAPEHERDPNSAYDRFFIKIAWIGGFLSFTAAIIGIYLVYKHLRNYVEPVFQRYVVRVIFMIPTFAICAWLALVVDENKKIYVESVQGIYEVRRKRTSLPFTPASSSLTHTTCTILDLLMSTTYAYTRRRMFCITSSRCALSSWVVPVPL